MHKLEELKRNLRVKKWTDTDEKEAWIEEKEDLEKQEKKLEIQKDEWKEELRKWAEKLRAAIDDTEYLVYNAYYFLFSMVILEHLAKRARLDMPDNTSSFLELLCRPFDEPITRSNLENCFTSKLLQKLPTIGEHLVLNSSNRGYNYQVLKYTINFFRILRTLCRDQYITAPILRLFDDIQRSHCVVTILLDKIIKKIDKTSIVDLGFHKNFYQNTLPGLEPIKVLDYYLTNHSVVVHLAPVGFKTFPECEPELRDAIRHVLVTLEKLHKMNVFREKLMNKNSNSRPTANDALKDEWFNLPEEQLSIMQA
ncbi:hypothetical protein G9A89_004062 [Geosiphon pyriformis]|nr:hypothetical protein G9A89_004062 [Geosiphon pyriformis]